ncbi:MAG: hypothetical protein WCG27_06910 [Pseudomonadota bacterium]
MLKINTLLAIFIMAILMTGCKLGKDSNTPKNTLFIGVDISGSFNKTESFRNGLKFLSYYIYGHIQGLGGLSRPKDMYVGGIGGNIKDDPQAFYPIHAFQGLQPAEIEVKLEKYFSSQKDNLTDFNVYFEKIALLVKQKNLTLAPINIVLVSDGVPEVVKKGGVKHLAYANIKLDPIEYLARNISLRLIYTSPKVGNDWVKQVPSKRIKIWTVESTVMFGWQDELKKGEDKLWKWIADNIDRRINRGFLK